MIKQVVKPAKSVSQAPGNFQCPVSYRTEVISVTSVSTPPISGSWFSTASSHASLFLLLRYCLYPRGLWVVGRVAITWGGCLNTLVSNLSFERLIMANLDVSGNLHDGRHCSKMTHNLTPHKGGSAIFSAF